MDCLKRQKVVTRGSDGTKSERFRCLNGACPHAGGHVDLPTCNGCPFRSVKHKRPCKQEVKATNAAVEVPPTPELANPEDFIIDEKDFEEIKKELPEEISENGPPMRLMLINYKDALARWNRLGRPKRSDEEVKRLLKICKACPWYDSSKQRCKNCGCKVTAGGMAVLNKLRMATETCPLDKW